jgi:hypothetical protein
MKQCEHFHIRKSGGMLVCTVCEAIVYVDVDGVYVREDVLVSNESAEKYAPDNTPSSAWPI